MSITEDAAARKKALIDAAKSRVVKPDALTQTKKPETKIDYIPAEQCTNKIRIVFDNSGSMGTTKMEDAKKGTVEFLRNCVPNSDAVAVHLLEQPYSSDESSSLSTLLQNSTLTSDLVSLASAVDSPNFRPTGGTPLYATCINTLNAQPRATRIVAFSDGAPNYVDRMYEPDVIRNAKDKKIPIDTVYFGAKEEEGYNVMQRLAEATGGIFLHFDPAKGVDFKTAFKYLSPGKRLMLADKSFVAALESGRVK